MRTSACHPLQVLRTSEQSSTGDYPHSPFLDMMRGSLHFSICAIKQRPRCQSYGFNMYKRREFLEVFKGVIWNMTRLAKIHLLED